MKITAPHLESLTKALTPLDTPEKRAQYASGEFPRADAVKDLDKRYRWDLLFAAGSFSREWTTEVYKYADDTHIDTALRSIIKPLTVEHS